MFHSDVEFGAKYADCVKEEALEELESETQQAFPHCPEPSHLGIAYYFLEYATTVSTNCRIRNDKNNSRRK